MAVNLTGKRILVIDDFPEMRSMMRKMSVAFGATDIDDVRNGEEALKLLAINRYDIILCDYNLGDGKDGQNVLEEAKFKSFIHYSTIFMMITAESTMKMVMGAMEYYPDGYLTKPFSKAEFSSRIEKIQRHKNNFKEIEKAIQRNDYQKALEACDQKLAENPANAFDIMKAKADILDKMSKYEPLIELYNAVLEKRDLAWAQLGLAKTHYHLGKYNESQLLLESVIQENPNFTEAYDWLAKALEALNNTQQAQDVLKKAIEISPKAILRHKALGKVAHKNSDLDTAELAYKATLKLGKRSCFKDPNDYSCLSKVYLEKDNPGKALALLDDVKKEFENTPSTNFQAAVMESMIHKHAGNNEQAEQAIHQANEIFNSLHENVSVDAVMDLAKTCFALGKMDEGEHLAKYIVRNHHEDNAVLAQTQSIFDEFNMSELGNSLINDTRQEVIDTNNQGVKLTKEGRLEEAIDFFKQAAVAMPENKTINLNAAQALIMFMKKQGKNDLLIKDTGSYLERVQSIDPGDEKYQKLKSFFIKMIAS